MLSSVIRERAERLLEAQRQYAKLRERKRYEKKDPVCLCYRLYISSQWDEIDQPIKWPEIQSLMTDLIGADPIMQPLYVRPLSRKDVAECFLRMYIKEAAFFVLNSDVEPFAWNGNQWHELLTLGVNPYIPFNGYEYFGEDLDANFLTSTELLRYVRRQLFPALVERLDTDCESTCRDDCIVPADDRIERDACVNSNVDSSLGCALLDSKSVDCNRVDTCTLDLDAFYASKPIVTGVQSRADLSSMLIVMGGNKSFNDGDFEKPDKITFNEVSVLPHVEGQNQHPCVKSGEKHSLEIDNFQSDFGANLNFSHVSRHVDGDTHAFANKNVCFVAEIKTFEIDETVASADSELSRPEASTEDLFCCQNLGLGHLFSTLAFEETFVNKISPLLNPSETVSIIE